MKHQKNQAGFTIVELMIATAIFSLILMICSFAIIHIGKIYYKGVIINRTQDASRRLVEDVASSIQFGAATDIPTQFRRTGGATLSGINVESLCLGNVRYSFTRDRYLGEVSHVVWRDSVTSNECMPRNLSLATPSADGMEMLGANMRIPDGIVVPLPTGQLWNINLTVSYGNNADLFVPATNFKACRGVSAGGQFCAVSGFSTSVTKRL